MKTKKIISTLYDLVRYNLKIIFAGKFLWFLLASFAIYAFLMVNDVMRGSELSESLIFGLLFFPGLLLVFYPAVFGIQNDEDNKILEILFGIPNYRYKVWLLRLVIIYFVIGAILLLFAFMGSVLVYPIDSFSMVFRLMFPVIFVGNLAFMLSTWIRSGNGTAVVLIILVIGMIFLMATNTLGIRNSFWNVMLDPYMLPDNVHPLIWKSTLLKNMIFLSAGSIVWLLVGLLNLQNREKFI